LKQDFLFLDGMNPHSGSRTPNPIYFQMSKHFPFTLLSFAAALLFTFQSHASSMQFSGAVGTNAVWNVDTVHVVGDVLIPVGCTLTINPGTLVQMMGYYTFHQSGTIRAIGTAADSIRFTYYDTTGLANQTTNSGGWCGMYVQNTNVWISVSDSTVYDYCVFEYMKEGPGWNAGNLTFINSARVRFSNSVFRYNYNMHYRAALYAIDGSSMLVTHCSFHHNTGGTGGGICMYDGSNLYISWCTFYNNYVDHTGGAIHAQNNCSATIVNNFICNNTTRPSNCGPSDGGGGIRLIYGGNSYVANNVIANNLSGMAGGGIECMWGATALLEHNTIVNNSSLNHGAGLFIQESNVTVKNNIFWGNRSFSSQNYEIDFFSSDSIAVFNGDILNNCIEGGTAAIMFTSLVNYTGNISFNFDSLPQFVAPSAGAGTGFNGLAADWTLLPASACINGASGGVGPLMLQLDLYGNPRLSGWQYDVGAFEDPTVLSIAGHSAGAAQVFPNPAGNEFTIAVPSLPEGKIVSVSVYDAQGKVVFRKQQTLSEKIKLDAPAGLYNVIISSDDALFSTTVLHQ
jgi:predicted outer membrane repeat protein